MIYIKNICKLDEKLIVEKRVHNEQSFDKFECCFVDTLSTLFLFFRLKQCYNVYIFFSDFYHEIILNINFAVFLFRVSVCHYFTASNIKLVNVLYCKRSSAIVT